MHPKAYSAPQHHFLATFLCTTVASWRQMNFAVDMAHVC